MTNLGKEVEIKKKKLILIKFLFYIVLFILPFGVLSQDEKVKTWKTEREYLKYEKSKKYEGPDSWYGSEPSSIKSKDPYSGGSNSSYGSGGGIRYSPQQIQKDRNRKYRGFDRGGGNGTLKFDPKVEEPDPIDIPDVDAPDIDLPDIDIDPPSFSAGFWKVLLFILIFAAVLTLIYLIFKNKKPANKKIIVNVENNWNPEIITKTELELKLQEAIEKGDYREGVRIYFTFILKELIKKGWIIWKKEKTNHHYVMEMGKRPNALVFLSCVRIYDLVWYGDYQIDEEIFEMLKPELETYYKSLISE